MLFIRVIQPRRESRLPLYILNEGGGTDLWGTDMVLLFIVFSTFKLGEC